MPTSLNPPTWFPPKSLLAYSAALAAMAGFINSVALLVWAFPVGNLTALTTQAGMHSTYPLLYQGRMIAAIVGGFFLAATAAGAALAATRTLTSPRHATVLYAEAVLLIAAAGIEHPIARAALAASACGLQNAMSSNFPTTPIRTTHFTGTITDLALLLGRSRRHGLDRAKATLLGTTVALFVAGAAAGVLLGNRIGDHALIPPAAASLALAAVITRQHRRHRARDTPRDDHRPASPAINPSGR